MRTIKSGLFGLILLVVVASASFLTCDVGLGSSVDTKPPTVTIAYPPVQSIIKNTFTMSGAASDDTSLATVTVGVVNTVTAATYGPFTATIEPAKSAWSLVVNNHTDSGYEIRDGTYEMTVTAIDGAGRKSVATTTYEIDNTPPVVVIERPGTNGPLASVAPEVYGTELKITGSINDDHAIDKLVLTAYDPSGNVVGSPITQTNISGVAMDITLAKSYKAPATSDEVALNALYDALHNNPDSSGTQNYYCTITASDSAREYNPPSAVASADNTRGNINSVYYVYDDVYSTIFSATGYAVTMKDLTAMFNGSYADAAKSAAVLKALAAKARPAAAWSTASATFSLNPKNSPSFTVQGYDPFTNGSDITLAKNQKANATDLTVVVHTGRDAIPLNKDSLKVTLVPCSATAVPTGVGTTLLPSLAECGGDTATRDAKITKSGTDYLIQVTVNGDANNYYRIEVLGADQSGNDIDNFGAMYGFMVVTNGLPPTIVVLTPTLNSYTAATVASHSVAFSGTIDSENGTPELMLSGYSETKVGGTRYTVVDDAAFDKDNPATYVPITLTPSGTANRWNWSYTIDTLHNLSDANAKSVSATAAGNGEDLYTYNMILYARNKTNSPAQVTHVFFVDSAPPTAELVSVTPTTTASPPPYDVNGIISAVLRFADNDRITAATYQLGSDPAQTIPTLNGYTIANIDTRKYDDASGKGPLPLTVTLTDRAGLTSAFHTDLASVPAWLINIDQSLDKPKLSVNYANTAVTTAAGVTATTNLYGRDGYTAINGTVSDDDGIASVVVHITGDSDSVEHVFPATVTGSTFSCDLSGLAPGYYVIGITATDNALGETASTPTFKIGYDTDLPAIDIANPDGQFQKTALHLTGTRSDGSGISSFTCMKDSESVTITPDAANAWHVDIPKPGASEQRTLTFIAKDTYGRTTTKTFTYKYDLDSPTVTVTTVLAAQPATNYFNQNYALTIKGEAAEAVSANPQSGLSEIQYAVCSGLSATLPGTPDWKTATGSANWAANVDLTNSATYPDGPYTVFIRSVDLMENASVPVSYNVTGDRVAPTLTETQINTTNTVYKPATFDLGGDVSDAGSGIASLSYTINGGAPNSMGAVVGTAWTLHQDSLGDGTYEYIVTAKDNAGIVSTVTRKVTIDNTKPTCSITSPAAANNGEYIKADSFNFKGEASDTGSGVGSIKLTINGVVTAISPVEKWSSIQDLTGLAEDTLYTATLDVADNAGNTEADSRTFKVDRSDPRATITVSATTHGVDDGAVWNREAPFSISGICDDDATGLTGKKAASAVLSCAKDGGTSDVIASTIASDGKPFSSGGIAAGTWSYSQVVDTTGAHANDGLYVYTLTVTDVSGRVSTDKKTVRVDTSAPTVAVTAPVSNEQSASATYTFQGTASDLGSGIDVSTLTYSLDGGAQKALSLSGASWTAASVPLGAEGAKSFVVNCKDKLGNAIAPIAVNFYYDLNKPELNETKVGTTTLITKQAFYFEGTCLDTNQMKEVDISATRQGVPAATKTWTWDPIVKSAKNTSETWKQDITVDKLQEYDGESNGTYTFTIAATDIAGKTTAVQRTVIVDTKAPTLGNPVVTTETWLKSAVQTVSGTVEDNTGGSGLASVEYAIVTDGMLDTESWYSMTVTGTTYSGAISIPDGTNNVIYIRATDRANNTQITPASGAIWVDTQNPELTIDSPTSVVTMNGTKSLSIDVTGTDAAPGSGLAGFAVSAKSDMSAPIATISYASPYAASKTGSLSVPAANIAALGDGSQKLYVQATDAAGRTSTPTIVTILVDMKAPSGKVTSHGASATVNKTIDFSGTASDENGLPTTSVAAMQVWKGTAGTSDPSPTDAGWEPVTTAQHPLLDISGSYSWFVKNFDTTKYSSADYDARSDVVGFQLCARVLVVDNAGNTGYINQTFTVDQDSDRPTIKLSNVNPDGTTTLKLSGVVYGSISDDDGISLLEISKTGSFSDGTDDDVAVNGGTWMYDAGGDDGVKTLYFRVTDSKGSVFTTNAANDDNLLVEPKIQYGSNYSSSSVSYRVDTIAPEVSSTNPVVIDRTSALVFDDPIPIATNLPLGGGVGGPYSQFRLRVLAKDANGIASVVATIPGVGDVSLVPNGTDATETTFTRFDSDANTATVGVYEPTDISGLADGAITITIVVTDKSGLKTTLNRTVLIDNHGPTITHSSPRNDNTADVVNGDAVVKGAAADSGVGMKSLMYQTGFAADRARDSSLWKAVGGALFSWEIDYKAKTGVGDETGVDGNKIDVYAGLPVSLDVGADTFTLSSHGYATGTVVYFGGGGTLPNEGGSAMSVTVPYYVIRIDDNTFKVASTAANATIGTAVDFSGSYTNELSVSKYSKDSDNNGLWELPIVLRAEDNAGNVTIEDYTTYIVHVDPTGDKPKVSIVYPAEGQTLGGIIRIFGTATDDDAVKEVYMQIDANGDGLYTSADDKFGTSTVDWFNGGTGQLVSGTASWNETINESKEFNPTGDGTRTIHFRVRAKDINDPAVWGAWSSSRAITIDSNVPKIGSSSPLMLVQYTDNTFTTIKASKPYVDDMYIRGTWYLIGSIEDESGINSVTISNSMSGNLSTIDATSGKWFTAKDYAGGTMHGYEMRIPLVTTGSGKFTIQIDMTDKSTPMGSNQRTLSVKYDNAGPVQASYSIASIVQSNMVYTISSNLEEGDSGLDKIAFYFERNVSDDSKDRLYNVMESRAGGANLTYLSSLTTIEGLPCLSLAAYTLSGDGRSLTSAALSSANTNVRVGGLVYVGGTFRRIDAMTQNASSGTITWADAATDTGSAAVAYAMVVDNTTQESVVYKTDNVTIDHIKNDDGDGMPESIVKTSSTYVWDATFNSKNIPDGPIELHLVAFDKAGNYTERVVTTSVQNNRPKIASVILGTDLNGDSDTGEAGETITYSALDGSNNPQSEVTIGSSAFIAKGLTSVKPTIIGGNGKLQYTLKVGAVTVNPLTTIRADEVSAVSEVDITEAQLKGIGEGSNSFVFKIWDSTEEMTPGANDATSSQYAILTTPFVVDVVDNEKPKNVISPFFWTAEAKGSNSLYNGSRANGHIELGTVPAVSGIVSVRGTAYDDQRIDELYVHIGKMAMGTPITSVASNAFNATAHGYKDGDTVSFDAATLPTELSAATAYYVVNSATDSFSVSTTKGGSVLTVPDGTYAKLVAVTRISGDDYMLLGSYNAGAWSIAGNRLATCGLAASVADVSINQGGHRVSWQLDWDSSFILNAAQASATIKVATKDRGGNLSTFTLNNTPGDDTTCNVPTYDIAVVPYVAKVETTLSKLRKSNPSVFNRTALGHYPVASNESVTIYGFNLANAMANGVSLTAGAKSGAYDTATFPVSVLKSGKLTITNSLVVASPVSSQNNTNSNAAEYNKLPNGDNNNDLTDDVVLDVWEINASAAVTRLANNAISEPVMKINPKNGVIGFAFANGVDTFSMPAPYDTAVNAKISYQTWQQNYDDYAGVTFAYDTNGQAHGIVIGRDLETSSGLAGRMNYLTSKWGRSANYNQAYDNFHNENKVRIESVGMPMGSTMNGDSLTKFVLDKTRFRSPSIAVATHSAGEAVYLAYYDNMNGQIRFRAGSNEVTAKNSLPAYVYSGATTAALYFGQFVDNLGYYALSNGNVNYYKSSNVGYAQNAEFNGHAVFESLPDTYSLIAGRENDKTGDTGNAAGEYLAIDVIPGTGSNDNMAGDVVVIVWYDGTDLKYIYRSGAKGDINAKSTAAVSDPTKGDWSKPITVFSDMGKYCAIKADKNGGVHIAAYDSLNGDLKYAYLSTYAATSDDDVKRCTVDAYGIVGDNISIDAPLNAAGVAVPYISYYMASTGKPKIAYLRDPAADHAPDGVDTSTEAYNGKWEISLVPTGATVRADRVNVGLWEDSNGKITTSSSGTSSSTDANGVCYGNGSTNPVVGYATIAGTTGKIETAQMRTDQ